MCTFWLNWRNPFTILRIDVNCCIEKCRKSISTTVRLNMRLSMINKRQWMYNCKLENYVLLFVIWKLFPFINVPLHRQWFGIRQSKSYNWNILTFITAKRAVREIRMMCHCSMLNVVSLLQQQTRGEKRKQTIPMNKTKFGKLCVWMCILIASCYIQFLRFNRRKV